MRWCLVLLGVSAAAASAWGQNLVVNGGFESPALSPGAFQTIGPGGEPAGFAWTVSSGTVDLGRLPVSPFILFPAFEGNQGIDLNGVNRGAIFQVLATIPGQAYRLSFGYGDNPVESGVSTADVRAVDVLSGGILLSATVSHSTSTNSPLNPDYQVFFGEFTATGATTRLSFESTSLSDTASGGILLDAVSVTPVPEPASVVLGGALVVGLLSFQRRRRANRCTGRR